MFCFAYWSYVFIWLKKKKNLFRNGRKNNPGEVVIQSENGERRVLRSTPDWTEEAINGDHLWVPTSASGDLCHVLDQDCTVSPQFLFPVLLLFASLIVRQSTNRNVFNYKSFSNYLPSFFKDFIVADDFGSKPRLYRCACNLQLIFYSLWPFCCVIR